MGCEQAGQTIMTLLTWSGCGDVEDAALLDARLAVGAALALGARLGVALGDVDALDHDRGTGQRRDRAASRRRACAVVFFQPCRLVTTRWTVPRLPASLPVSTSTSSPLRMSGTRVRAVGRGGGRHHSTSGASETIFM